jgi:hypothetical protein
VLDLGATYTLISSGGAISGTFAEAPTSGSQVAMDCTGTAPLLDIYYNTPGSPSTVTATVVGPADETNTDLTVGPYIPQAGSPVILSANVTALTSSGGAPTAPVGTVKFESGGAVIAGCASQPLILAEGFGDWFANCDTTAGAAGSNYSYQALFVPTDPVTGGQLPSSSALATGGVASAAPSAPPTDTPVVGNATTNGLTASVPVSCEGTAGSSCTVALSLSVLETLKGGKVIAVAAKTKTTKRTVNVGSATTTVGANDDATVLITLNSSGKAMLKSHHKLAVKLTAEAGATVLGSQTVTFKYPTKK